MPLIVCVCLLGSAVGVVLGCSVACSAAQHSHFPLFASLLITHFLRLPGILHYNWGPFIFCLYLFEDSTLGLDLYSSTLRSATALFPGGLRFLSEHSNGLGAGNWLCFSVGLPIDPKT